MTVYPDVESARIDPKVLGNDHTVSAVPVYLRRWIKEAHSIYDTEEISYAYKAGYFYGIIQLIENYFNETNKGQG